MPSRHSYVASIPLAPLSEIIKLEPEKEPWCAGYAPSQGRRCHARTNAHGRYSAMMLLNEGTKDLRAGRNIDVLLEDLAPYVLCTRFHQNQASDLTRRWKRQVRKYLDSQVASAPPASLARLSSRRVHLERTIADLEDQLALLEDTVRERRLEVAQYDQSMTTINQITINHHQRQASNTRSVVSSSSGASASSISTPGQSLVDGTARRRSTESTNPPEITVARPTQAQVGRQTRAVSVSNPPATPQTPVRASSTSGDQNSEHETSQVNRREVEGECGICFCTLHLPQQDGDTEEAAENSEDDEDDDESDDDSDDNESDYYESDDESDGQTEDGDDDEEQELTWCKACCGVNYHKQCIDRWLETARAPTCPTCRSDWKR